MLKKIMPELDEFPHKSDPEDVGRKIWGFIKKDDHVQLQRLLEDLPNSLAVLLNNTTEEFTYVQYCCLNNLPECLQSLLQAGANPNLTGYRNTPAIILAARRGHAQILKYLLAKTMTTDINAVDTYKATALHYIVVFIRKNPPQYLECLKTLLDSEKKSDIYIDAIDIMKNTALHVALYQGVEEAVLLLLRAGASLSVKNTLNQTPIRKILPTTLEKYLDECMVLTKSEENANENYITFNYNFLAIKAVQPPVINIGANQSGTNCVNEQTSAIAKHTTIGEGSVHVVLETNTLDQDVKWSQFYPLTTNLDKKWLDEQTKVDEQCYPETEALWDLSRSSRHRYLLRHPVVTSLLSLKWHKLQRVFSANVILYMSTVHILTTYTLIREEDPRMKSPNLTEVVLYYVLLIQVGLICMRELLQFSFAPLWYLLSLENYLDLGMLFFTGLVLSCPTQSAYMQDFSALAVLFAWAELLFMLGSHPRLSVFVAMFTYVTLSFLKYLLWFSTLIIGFAFSLHLVLRNPTSNVPNANKMKGNGSTIVAEILNYTIQASKQSSLNGSAYDTAESGEETNQSFKTVSMAILKTVSMMTGDLESSLLSFNKHVSPFIFTAFVFLITVVLMSLLNGLAVSDIQTIQSQSEIISATRFIQLATHTEAILLGDPLQFMCRHSYAELFGVRCCVAVSKYCRSFLQMSFLQPFLERYSTLLFKDCLPHKAYTAFSDDCKGDKKGSLKCKCHKKYALEREIIEAALTRLQEKESAKVTEILGCTLDELRKTVNSHSEKLDKLLCLLQSNISNSCT